NGLPCGFPSTPADVTVDATVVAAAEPSPPHESYKGSSMSMSSHLPEVVIVAARRTPIGSLNGALAPLPGHQLGAVAMRAVLADTGLEPAEVDEVILGQVLTAGQGMNPARQAARLAG